MRRILESTQHHGKNIITHAKKHHRKYLLGAAGFFGLFKIFSFIIASILSYTTIANASLQEAISIAIPATTIDIQDNKSIIQFDLSNVDIGTYKDITNMSISIHIPTENPIWYLDTLRNTTATNIGHTEETQRLGLEFQKNEKNIRTLKQEWVPSIIQQLISGNTIVYLLPEEHINIEENRNIIMELTLIQNPETENETDGTIIPETNSIVSETETGIFDTLGDNDTSIEESGIDTSIDENITTGEIIQETGYQVDEYEIIQENNETKDDQCRQYDKKNSCENIQQCRRDKQEKICNNIITRKEEKYQLTIIDENNIETDESDIEVHSNKTYQKIHGYLKIPKLTKLHIEKENTTIEFQSPTLITEPTLEGTTPKEGIPENFIHIETVQVGDPNNSISVATGSSGFTISIEIANSTMIPGTVLYIYTSQDGSVRENLGTTCMIDSQNICTFTSPHLTLFAVGTITRNDLEFITQRFRDNSPTTTQIIDALYGITILTRTAYKLHWRRDLFAIPSGCRPTTIVYWTPGTKSGQNLNQNTVYILHSGNYITTGQLTLSGCSAILGSGTVTITKAAGFLGHIFYATGADELIIDNLQLNGSGQGSTTLGIAELIRIDLGYNTTINDVQIYNNYGEGVYINRSVNTLINNSQAFNNTYGRGIGIRNGSFNIINNTQVYNNVGNGIFYYLENYGSINNTQSYNNSSYGIALQTTTGISINNIQTNNNGSYGLYLTTARNIIIHTIKSFRNTTYQVYATSSSGQYRGQNIISGSYSIGGFSIGNYRSALGWNTGSITAPAIGLDCNLVTNPFNGYGTGLYTTGNNCSTIGRITTWNHLPTITYLYGNDMTSAYYFIPRQKNPVSRQGGLMGSKTLGSLSNFPYHGHRFIGEYDNPSKNDINIPVAIFTGNTPPQGFNLINSGYFSVTSYIYEPNISFLRRYERFPTTTTMNTYSIYDSGLVFMANLDNMDEIGENTTTVKNLSLPNLTQYTSGDFGIVLGGASRTGNGKWNGAYIFPGTGGGIVMQNEDILEGSTQSTKSVWIKITSLNSGETKDIITKNSSHYIAVISTGTGIRRVGSYMYTSCPSRKYSNENLALNTWYHIAETRSGTEFNFYINGELDSSYTCSSSAGIASSAYSLTIGGIWNGNYPAGTWYTAQNRQFSGFIDEPRIRKRALSSGEIYNLSISNLAAKNDHREYTINYTGVQDRQNGTYMYGFNKDFAEMADADSNTGTATGHVVKYLNCGAGFTITRDNNNFLNSGFRSQNPTSCDIIYALHGTGTTGGNTAYNNHCGGGQKCNYTNTQVIYLTGGTDKIPENLLPYTIYVLASGTYIQTYEINTIGDCSNIIGSTGTATIYRSTSASKILNLGAGTYGNIFIDNIHLHGSGNGAGGYHAGVDYAIYNRAKMCSTFNNLEITQAKKSAIYNNNTSVSLINNTTIKNTFGADSNAIHYQQGGTEKLYNTDIYGTTLGNGIFIYLGSRIEIGSGMQIFNNKKGIYLKGNTKPINIDNGQIYNNTNQGIYLEGSISELTLNNLQIFNNSYGIQTPTDAGDLSTKQFIAINNSQIYNNANDGVLIYRGKNPVINNTHIYNNSGNGIYFAGTNNDGGILNNMFIYNNTSNGIISAGGNHKYYGGLTMFSNSGINIVGLVDPGLMSTFSYLGRTGGSVPIYTGCINCSRISNPFSVTFGDFINTTTHPKCNVRGQNTTWTGNIDLEYTYGINLTGQKAVVYRSGTTLTGSSLAYSGAQYVAEANKIGTYTNTTCSCLGNSFRWNNDNFINSGFWNNNPNYCDIIAALYGTGLNGADRTAYTYARTGYTEQRSNECNIENMDVIYLTGGTGKITYDTTPNTIYVLSSGNYIQTGNIGLDQCTAIVGVSTGTNQKIILYSTGTLGNMISTYIYSIIDNIFINGTGGGVVPPHTANSKGISLGQRSSTINNTSIYNNSVGLEFFSTIYNQISNSKIYNNAGNGILMYAYSKNNIFTNMHIYNNGANGIYAINNSENLGINNSQIYNNGGKGIYINSINNAINNSHIYNNAQEGIYIGNFGANTKINKSSIYNNNTGIYIEASATNSKYYDDLRLFDNTQGDIGGTLTNLTTGSSSDYPGFGRTNGNLVDTGILTRDYFSNPQNANTFLLSFTGYDFDNLIGIQAFATTEPIIYSYGTGISTQIQPVHLNGTTLTTGGTFSGDLFIGGNTKKITGDLLGVPSVTTSSGLTITGTSSSALVTRYGVRGNTANIYTNMSIGTSTGIFLDQNTWGPKRIVTFLYKQPSTDGFLIHFEKQSELVDIVTCKTGRDNNNFITGAFRSGTVTDSNIICALYGTGIGDTTAYTQFRTGRNTTQCDGPGIDVIYTGAVPENLVSNTIYVIYSGTQSISTARNMANCSAIISSGNTIITNASSNALFSANTKYSAIIDNIKINGGGNGVVGIGITNGFNVTMNNIQSYNNSNYGVGIRIDNSQYNSINNSQTYNNYRGIYITNGGNHNIINNVQSYNNNIGILLLSSSYNAINNSQTYNNRSTPSYGNGIMMNTSNYNTINNVQSYNNESLGVHMNGSNNSINNISVYNNNYGIYVPAGVSNNLYYGSIHMFGNITANFLGTNGQDSYLTGGTSSSIGWNNGQIIDTGILSRDYMTIPRNNNGAFMLSLTGYTRTGLIGEQIFSIVQPILYSYGSGTLTGIQPVYYSGTTLKTGGIFDATKFIGSDLKKITGNLLLPTTTATGGITVTGTAGSSLVEKYNIGGNTLTTYGSMNLGTHTGIFLDTTTLGIKRVLTQLVSGTAYYAMHFEKQIEIVDPCLSGWNNDNFVDASFRAMNPSDANIICALYGSGGNDQTAYTRIWDAGGYDHTDCLDGGMTVQYPGSIPTSTPVGTIYVLPNGTYNHLTGIANLNTCVAFISSGSTTIIANGHDYYLQFKNYGIIDNIAFDGTNSATYGINSEGSIGNTVHGSKITQARYGIRMADSDYHLIDDNGIQSNDEHGMAIGKFADRNVIKNNKIFKNVSDGILIVNSQENIIDNNQIFQNSNHGISLYQSSINTIINNNVIFNNDVNGIYIDDYANYTFINNNNIYNNSQYGIETTTITTRTNINNTLVYNNSYGIVSNGESDLINNCDVFNNSTHGITSEGYGLWIANTSTYNNGNYGLVVNGSDMYYFGDIYSFENGDGPYSLNSASQGSANTDFDWTDGALYDDQCQYNCIERRKSRDYLINPKNNNGEYLLSWNPDINAVRGDFSFAMDIPIIYSYGSGILGQSVPVFRNVGTSNYMTGGTYTGENYIGGGPIKYTGSLLVPGLTYTTGITVTGQANTSQISGYNLYSTDLFTGYEGTSINTSTGIFFDIGDGIKTIITQIYSPSYFATHFQTTGELNTEIDCAWRWNNSNFITGYFWQYGPTDENIICALYGNGPNDTTAYTQFRTGWDTTQCSGIFIDVVYTGKLNLTTLADNTIYVMTGADSTGNSNFTMSNCSAIISNRSTGTTFNKTIQVSNVGYTISDNINISGGGTFGMLIMENKNNTINNMSTYNNWEGISSRTGTYNIMNNIRAYNNNYGINLINESIYNRINNTQVYNNNYGVNINISSKNSLNNIQSYNNYIGINLGNDTTKNIINNAQIFNNAYMGILLISTTNDNNINNTTIINNGRTNNGAGIYLDASATNIKYYGINEIFGNYTNIGGTTTNLITGLNSDYPNIFSAGTVNISGIVSRDYFTNPINTNNNYLSLRSGAFTGSSIVGQQTAYNNTTTNKYSYGSGILTQTQPVYYSGTSVKTGGAFSPTKYIGSDLIKVTGNLLGVPTTSIFTSLTVTGTAASSLVAKYSVFGDITTYKTGQNKATSTGIVLITGLASNRIVTQLWHNTIDYFATHFQKTTTIDQNIYCMTGRDNDNFLNSGFWNNNPTDSNIICALYGTGPNDTTAYTQFWSGRDTTQCSGVFMTVTHLTGGTGKINYAMATNTIFVLSSGNYIQTGSIATNNCTAIVGKTGNIVLYSTGKITANGMIASYTKKHVIIDNIGINGTGGYVVPAHTANEYGIVAENSSNMSINNIQVYNNNRGTHLAADSGCMVNNSQFFNNIERGISLGTSNSIIINNIQSYNNGGGMIIQLSWNNSISNSQIYNNFYNGIRVTDSADNNLFDTIQIYNNASNGMSISSSSNNILHNIQSYNNTIYGIRLRDTTDIIYYGTGILFDNASGNTGGNSALTQGTGIYYSTFGRMTGSIDDSNCIACSHVTNPMNENGEFLVDTGIYTHCEMRGGTGRTATKTIGYTYGVDIEKQENPIIYDGTTLSLSSLAYDSGVYLAEINNIGTDNNGQCNCAGVTYRRNNDTLITGLYNFRNHYPEPNYCDIIAAFYGTGIDDTSDWTAYTTGRDNRDGSCNLENMNVIVVDRGTGNIPQTLAENTIYVLKDNSSYITTGVIDMNNCTAIVGKKTRPTLYSQDYINSMIAIDNVNYTILDHIKINGNDDGRGNIHTTNPNNIGIAYNAGINNTINYIYGHNNQEAAINGTGNNINIYNSFIYDTLGYGSNGIYLYNTSTGKIENTEVFQSFYGITFDTVENISIRNSKIYNNSVNGITYGASTKNILNNSQIYNNGYRGIFSDISSYNTINNSQIYNNNNAGIYYDGGTDNFINNSQIYNNDQNGIWSNVDIRINDSQVYNNSGYGIYKSAGNIYYYGILSLFDNTLGDVFGGTINAGNSNDYPGVEWNTGTFNGTSTIHRDYITNPKNSLDEYMLPRGSGLDEIFGVHTFTINLPTIYSYGSGIRTQTQPVVHDGTNLLTGGIYDETKYIGSDVTKVTGDIEDIPTFFLNSGLTVTGVSNDSLVTNYSLYGNIVTNILGQDINTSTGIILITGLEINRIITQLYNPFGYFATHFEKSTEFNSEIDCASRRDNDNFITGGFRNHSPAPTDDNIICALYGSGVGDTTAYTQFRSGWNTTQCSGVQMNVVYTGSIPSPFNLESNKIYVVTSGEHIITNSTNMNNCSAIVSSGTTSIKKGANIYGIVANSKTNRIIDNIDINGNGQNTVGIHIQNTSPSNTINNINVYRNGSYGIYIQDASHYNIINNSNFYNNSSYVYIGTQNNRLNNIQIYNNNNYGLAINNSYNTINNAQIYNNINGIYAGGTNNIYNNIQTYNNGNDGIRFIINTNTNIINNFMAYNNTTTGINTQGYQVTYFGKNASFNNGLGNTGSNLIAGSSSPLGWANGSLTTGAISWDYITNPKNSNNTNLFSWSGDRVSLRGYKSTFITIYPTNDYSYGSGIHTQIQPVYYSGTTLKTGGLFDSTKFIGSDIIKVTGDMEIIETTVTGISNNPLISVFSVFGDITTFKIGQTINTSTGINYTTGLTTNKIITQLRDNNYFGTHFQKEIIVQPIIYFTGTTPAIGQTGYYNNFRPEIEIIQTEFMDIFTYTFNGITYPYYDSGLILMMNLDKVTTLNETDSNIKDFSHYANIGSGYNGVSWTNNGRRGGAYEFDGSNDRIEITNKTGLQITGFTISARIKTDTITSSTQTIFSTFYFRGAGNYYGYLVRLDTNNELTLATFDGNDWTAASQILGATIQTGTYTYVTVTFDGTTGKIYINGMYNTGGILPTPVFHTDEYHADIGAMHVGGTTFGNIFSGIIDEPRIYSRVLSNEEILQMRRSNLSKYDTDKRRFIDDRQCIGDGTYTYTGYVSNMIAIDATTGRTTPVSITGYTPYAPGYYFIGSTGVSSSQVTLSGQFTGYFKLEDRKGTTGRYTTIQLPLIFTGTTYDTNNIINNGSNIKFMATGVYTEPGGTNSGMVYIYTGVNAYTGSTGALHYIKRYDTQSYYCPAGIYANKPYISIDIPAYQNPDTYSGMITIDINNP